MKMGIIRLTNIRVFTNHGCMVEEEKIGLEYFLRPIFFKNTIYFYYYCFIINLK